MCQWFSYQLIFDMGVFENNVIVAIGTGFYNFSTKSNNSQMSNSASFG